MILVKEVIQKDFNTSIVVMNEITHIVIKNAKRAFELTSQYLTLYRSLKNCKSLGGGYF